MPEASPPATESAVSHHGQEEATEAEEGAMRSFASAPMAPPLQTRPTSELVDALLRQQARS